jgi:sugar diacid utilization regulator
VAVQAACFGDPLFLPYDESSAWAWLPLGIRDTFDTAAASTADLAGDLHFAFGVARGTAGFRLTHQQAVAAQAVALAAGPPAAQVVVFGEVAPVAMMSAARNCCGPGWPRRWGAWPPTTSSTRLRETLLLFLQAGGSYTTAAERLMLHKNTVQYRIRRAEESLGRPVSENRQDVELALRATHWLGSAVLRPE